MQISNLFSFLFFTIYMYSVEINIPDFNDPRVLANDLKIFGFSLRVVEGYDTLQGLG